MSDQPTQPDQPQPQPQQPPQQPEPNQPEQAKDLGGQWQDANQKAKTNVGAELTDDESKVGDASSRAHNERVGGQQ